MITLNTLTCIIKILYESSKQVRSIQVTPEFLNIEQIEAPIYKIVVSK